MFTKLRTYYNNIFQSSVNGCLPIEDFVYLVSEDARTHDRLVWILGRALAIRLESGERIEHDGIVCERVEKMMLVMTQEEYDISVDD